MLACAPLTHLLCFLSPYPTHASGSILIVQHVSDRLAARHVVLVMCYRCADVCCWPAMLACGPLTCLICFHLPYPTHASGSILILQVVSDRLAAHTVVLSVSPQCAEVLLLPGYASMCPSDLPALLTFALPHECIWIPLDFAAGK